MVSCKNVLIAFILIVTAGKQCECGVYSIIRELLQYNVAGLPAFHQKTDYDFDPEVAQKRREQFYELHGYRASKYLERIGQGIDGRHRERQYQQANRDQGRLQGLNLIAPNWVNYS